MSNYLDPLCVRKFVNGKSTHPSELSEEIHQLALELRSHPGVEDVRYVLSKKVAELVDDLRPVLGCVPGEFGLVAERDVGESFVFALFVPDLSPGVTGLVLMEAFAFVLFPKLTKVSPDLLVSIVVLTAVTVASGIAVPAGYKVRCPFRCRCPEFRPYPSPSTR